MNSIIWIASALLGVLFIKTFVVTLRKYKEKTKTDVQPAVSTDAQQIIIHETIPDQLIIGQTHLTPLVTINSLLDMDAFENAKPLELECSKPIGKLNALLQAAPSILIAKEAHGKKLMEVVINGDLVRATDGNGLRPFAMSGGKITEQAKLYEADKLQNMINAAAVWQIASVVVAQKHLADISQKLDEIKNKVNNISEFLDNQRKARIQGTYEYLGQVYFSIKEGDLPETARTELENCERDLLEIQCHLENEFKQKLVKRVKHTETFGTEDLTNDIRRKILELEKLTTDITLCMKTRIAAWHVLSLFPGNPHLKIARRQSIEKSINSFSALGIKLKDAMFGEISEIKSVWNMESTLQERRDSLKGRCQAATSLLEGYAKEGMEQISQSEALLLKHDQPSKFVIQIENGQPIEARKII
ncbi:hypothetical protein SAMN05660284_01520 [Formivibrio citricus]|uniref:Uncharacterized protein n=1 Tax=Formivibrio citricus TaxID=83765 RepID=A0A1I4Z421_9NEIS|nr:hypothetical protein [Formivibrio citricus]SFN45034.1 hypothetical protein SAMN05660284_01520 [Formivibrio citricus]